ncbi:hypothetical protein K2173_023839 [Erythroxylum novogranatense]|uniref:FRIGIDA-like protein n=1 Tax=Erythroxylum novogranatense TaxID=1862640 RepID=A0AAV8TIC0_9ROSI|nr:hypothetical protein K2173_023839 [Erythroxylum novogranatense]
MADHPPPIPQRPPSLRTIELALKQIDTKKKNLKRAYDDLQAHSSLLSPSFSLPWPDLDGHFTSLQTHLNLRFQFLLQSFESSLETQNNDLPPSCHRLNSVSAMDKLCSAGNELKNVSSGDQSMTCDNPSDGRVDSEVTRSGDPSSSKEGLDNPVVARPELVAFCQKMNGKGLRKYLIVHGKERRKIRAELFSAMRVAPDLGTLVLDAMDGFYPAKLHLKGAEEQDLNRLRKGCSDLLEALMLIKPNLSDEVRERAKTLALEWKNKVTLNWEAPLEALCFLYLLMGYGLQSVFDVSELVDYLVVVARFKQAPHLCRAFGMGDKVADIISKLIDSSKQLLAVKFIFEFGLTDKFQPVPLLNAHLKDCKIFTKKVCKDKNASFKYQNEVRSREVNSLKSVLKLVEEHNLESELPTSELKKRIGILENQKENANAISKQLATSADNRSQQQLQAGKLKQIKKQKGKQQPKKQLQQSGNKRPRIVAPPSPAAGPFIGHGSSSISPYQHSHLQPAPMLPTAGSYGVVGSSIPVAPYVGSSAQPYGLVGSAVCFAGNSGPTATYQYSSESHTPSVYYERPAGYGGYSYPPQHHQPYYPM